MVTLPPEFVATKFPGYFWNLETQTLFSLKISGVLREMKKSMPNRWNHWDRYYDKARKGGYRISHEGHKKVLFITELEKLTEADSVIPQR